MERRFFKAVGVTAVEISPRQEEDIKEFLYWLLAPIQAVVMTRFYGIACEKRTVAEIVQQLGEEEANEKGVLRARNRALKRVKGFKPRIEKILGGVPWHANAEELAWLTKRVKDLEKLAQDQREILSILLRHNASIPEAVRAMEKSPIGELELTIRSTNCLLAIGVETVGELLGKTEEDLLRSPNFGMKSVREIKEVLESRGLRLTPVPKEQET